MRRISHLASTVPRAWLLVGLLGALLTACDARERRVAALHRTGFIANQALLEASGIQASRRNPGVYFLHNDDRDTRVYAISETGADLGGFALEGAVNRDWEDITTVPSEQGPLLVIADVGDNAAVWDSVTLYFVAEPLPNSDGRYAGRLAPLHRISLTYPDGPRDCESVAYDTYRDEILLISKRDVPAQIYSLPRESALSEASATLRFEGLMARLRPPSPGEAGEFGKRGWRWIAQPTGLDIDPDGSRAAVITYRSLYLFERLPHESWARALAREPVEFLGPPARQEEAVTWSADGQSILVTSENLPAPVFRIRPDLHP